MKIIALSGWKGSGKDTAADRLVDIYGYKKMSFAEPLKQYVSKEHDIPTNWLEDQKLKEIPLENMPVIPKDEFSLNMAKMLYREFRTLEGQMPSDYHVDISGAFIGLVGHDPRQLYWTPRALLILEGSVKRSIYSEYWSNRLVDSIFMLNNNNISKFVISDIRYRTEVEHLKKIFGKDLLVVRIDRHPFSSSTDSSEIDLDNYPFDLVIHNKGTREEFLEEVNKLALE